MKVAVVIPTRNDRPLFMNHCLYLLNRQTLKPDVIEIVNERPKSLEVDITYRYRIGCERAFDKGSDLAIFIEDDDWYSDKYIETIVHKWKENKKPHLFGLNSTVYYNIVNNKFKYLGHSGRASMMSTALSKDAVVKWGDDNYAYTDVILWRQLKGVAIDIKDRLCLGIKHGTGICGGGGHDLNWAHYDQLDADKSYLRSIVDDYSFEFYNKWNTNLKK